MQGTWVRKESATTVEVSFKYINYQLMPQELLEFFLKEDSFYLYNHLYSEPGFDGYLKLKDDLLNSYKQLQVIGKD